MPRTNNFDIVGRHGKTMQDRPDLFDPARIAKDVQDILDDKEYWLTPVYSLALQN